LIHLQQTGQLNSYNSSSYAPVAINTVAQIPEQATNIINLIFTLSLRLGSKGTEVMELQKYLNTHGFLVSTTGLGSPGQESSYFGQKTKSALINFQQSKGIDPIGIFGPKTRAAVNQK